MNPHLSSVILWERPAAHSLEYCHWDITDTGVNIAGMIILLLDGLPTQISYTINCDPLWRTRTVVVNQLRSGQTKQLNLRVDDEQIWRQDDVILPIANGLYDIDLQMTPATNTLPIRRLGLEVGESRELTALWVIFPGLTVQLLTQRYTRLKPDLYQYESPGFEAQIEVDELGIVTNYEGLWHRVTLTE